MHKRARIVGPILLLALLVGGGYWWWNRNANAAGTGTLSGSGTIEAEDVLITSEISGRVQALLVDEGQEVTAGQTLAKLDPALLEAQRDQAAAAVAVAEANLALLKAGSRPEDVAAAHAAVDQARAARAGAVQAYQNALKALQNPRLLDAPVLQAPAARDSAQRALALVQAGSRPEDIAAGEAALDQAQAGLQSSKDRLSATKTAAEQQVQQAALALTQAQARYALATSNWQYVQDTGNDPITP